MVKRLLFLRQALVLLDSEKKLRNTTDGKKSPSRMLTDNEWQVLESLAELLEPWKVAQQVLESETTVTSSIVLPYLRIMSNHLDQFINKADPSIEDDERYPGLSESLVKVAKDMKADLLTRWGNLDCPFNNTVVRGLYKRQIGIHPDFMLAHALDPRFKNLSFVIDTDNKKTLWDAILREMVIAR